MNCQSFQNELPEYAEGSLAAGRRQAADRHLAACADCRRRLQQELRMAETLARGFQQITGPLTLPPGFQERLLAALQNNGEPTVVPLRKPIPTGWRHLVWPASLAAGVLITCFRLSHLVPDVWPPGRAALSVAASQPQTEMVLHFVFCVPTYTFHRDGNQVVDVLANESCTVDITLHRDQSPNSL